MILTAFKVWHLALLWISAQLSASEVTSGNCPPFVPDTPCDDKNFPYYTFNGVCNKPEHPKHGAAHNSYARWFEPRYADGLIQPFMPVTANDISVNIFTESVIDDPQRTAMSVMFGQLVTHDIGDTDFHIELHCCGADERTVVVNEKCFSFDSIEGDQVKCNLLPRAKTTHTYKCNLDKPAEIMNRATPLIDGSSIYPIHPDSICKFESEERNGELFPLPDPHPEITCLFMDTKKWCPGFGDIRSVQNHGIAAVSLAFFREHPAIFNKLKSINSHWDEQKLCLETRKIVIAEMQNMVITAWLPAIIGLKNLESSGVIPEGYLKNGGGLVKGFYNPETDPNVSIEYESSISRILHSSIQGSLAHAEISADLKCNIISHELLSDTVNYPSTLDANNGWRTMLYGLACQAEEQQDRSFSKELTKHLFEKLDRPFHGDLAAIDVQRGYEHGVNTFLKVCSTYSDTYSKIKTMDDFTAVMTQENVELLKKVYHNPEDVSLYVGAILEPPAPGSILGKCATAIFVEQFKRLILGDRKWFWNPDWAGAFTEDQVKQINLSTFGAMICKNIKGVVGLQKNVFLKVSDDNPIIKCEEFHQIDLELWREDPSKKCGK